MSDQPNIEDTIPSRSGREIYQQFTAPDGTFVVLTYNDLWMMIVCQSTLDGDWTRTRQACMIVTDPLKKRVIADRLWALEQQLDGLPAIPPEVLLFNLHRAHRWFNERMVSESKLR
ncbi:MAG: hypothetical protein IAE80_07170 [Anaerolinea sp.]|nr:hypothetical protein [Anaerolinea sp.]